MRVRSGSGIAHEADEREVLGHADFLGQFDSRLAGFDSMPGQSGIDIDGGSQLDTSLRGGILQPSGHDWIVNHSGESWFALRECHGADYIVLARGLTGEEDAFDAGLRHQFTFGDRRASDADGSECDL